MRGESRARKNSVAGLVRHKNNYPGFEKEATLQASWAGLRFDRKQLITTDQQELRIFHPGHWNHEQGPDFLNAKIQIGGQKHFGHVELHLNADDWTRHGHHRDPFYDPVVLHVFLNQGKKIASRSDGTPIPELWLGDRIAVPFGGDSKHNLACAGIGRNFLPPNPSDWLEAEGWKRVSQKCAALQKRLEMTQLDWSQVLWEALAAAMGGPVNGVHFLQLAQQMPWSIIRKYAYSPTFVEALLFGSAGFFLGRERDDYQLSLEEHWEFFQRKHDFRAKPIPFKLHRMHPAGFPVLRIAQLAALVAQYRSLFQLLEIGEMQRFLKNGLEMGSEYWSYRYDFGPSVQRQKSELGLDAKERIVTNVLIPLSLLYAGAHREASIKPYQDLLKSMRPEHNKLTRFFQALELRPINGLQSQGMIGLYRSHCATHQCLKCPIGTQIMPHQP